MQRLKNIICLFSVLLLGAMSVEGQNKLKEAEKKKFDTFFYDAMNARALGDYGASFDLLEYCYSLDSTNATILYELGSFYNTIDEKKIAYRLFKQATDNDPSNYYFGTAYSILAFELGEMDEAIAKSRDLVKLYPERTNLYLYLAEGYKRKENYTKAIEALDQLEKYVGMNEQISIQKLQLYSMMKKEANAYGEIQKYIDKYPLEVKYYVLLADLYTEAEKYKEAEKVFEKAKAIDADSPYLTASLVDFYEKTGQKDLAEKEIKSNLVNPNMNVETKLAILTQYILTLQSNTKNTESANPLMDTLIVQHPQEPNLNLMYGNLLMLQQKKDAARAQFKIYAEANPTNPVGWEQMLSTTFPDSLKLSIEICEKALEYNSDQPQFYFYLGLSQYVEKNYEPALDAFNKGVAYVAPENKPLLSDFYGQIGDLYFHTEQKDSAFVAYDKALKANPNNLGVLNNYSYFLTLDKRDLDKAERMSALTIKAEPLNPTYLDTYGWVLFKQGAYQMAKIYIEKAMNYYTENKSKNADSEEISAEVYEHYGDVLYKTGDTEKALEYWQKAKDKGDEPSETLDKKIETKEYIEK